MSRIDLNLVRPFGPHLFQRLFGMRQGGRIFDVTEADRDTGSVAILECQDQQIRHETGRGLGREKVVKWTDFMV
jgi:hypothetical protein